MLLLSKNKRKPKTTLLVSGSITLNDNHEKNKSKPPKPAEIVGPDNTTINATQLKRTEESEHEQSPKQVAEPGAVSAPQTQEASPSNTSAAKDTNRELPPAAQPPVLPPKQALPAPTTVASPPRVSPPDTVSPHSNTTKAPKHHNNKRRHVRFHSVELQEYAVTVGDHPLCKGFFPLTLDWSHSRPKAFGINDYEAIKERRRSYELWELHMSARERWERLRLVTGMNETTLVQLERTRQHHRQ